MLFQGLKTKMAVKNMNFTCQKLQKIFPKALKNSFNKLDNASISARSAVIGAWKNQPGCHSQI